jgi:ATP-dependent Lhr-like helicase
MAIEYMDEPYSTDEIKNILNPLFHEWFFNQFDDFSPPQKYAIMNIHQRENTLVSSPTGSGKTLAAFGAILNELSDLAQKDKLDDRIYAVYISPLKALSRDINVNLKEPLEGMQELAEEELGIRIGIRTGDTTDYEKQKMRENPPHILITTPESLGIMLTTTKFVKNFNDVEWVIVDEVHSLAENKRGVHLSLTLERLQRRTNHARIGLSATVAPLEEVAKYLVGYDDKKGEQPRPCKIVDVQYLKELDLQVMSPVRNLIDTDHEKAYAETYKLMDELIQDHDTTLVFTNTRSGTERVVHHLKDRFPDNYVRIDEDKDADASSLIGAHHSSLSKQHRHDIENRLKDGDLKAVVSSTSLELGIDIGYIDLVILLGSPKSVARALQRIGRSGHKLHDQAKGRIIVQDRDDLIECSVLLKSALEGKIDRIKIPTQAMDVLAQQLLGLALEDRIPIDDAYETICHSYNYAGLKRNDFDEIVKYLAGDYASLEDRNVYAKIWTDDGMMGKRGRMTRVIYMTNIGTIPDESSVRVKIHGSDDVKGYIEEGFLERLKRGDVFVLGGDTYEFMYSNGMTAFVKATNQQKPTVPSWYSEMLPLSYDLAMDIQRFRRYMEETFDMDKSKAEILDYIHDYLYVDDNSAQSIYEYMRQQYDFAQIPHDKKIVIEHYQDGNDRYIIFHTLFGRRTNDVLSRAVAFAISQLSGRDVEIGISDNGFYLSTKKPVNARRALTLLESENLRDIMKRALQKTEVLKRRFRHCAGRALMILRQYKGREKSVGKQQVSSRMLLKAVRDIDDDFPILEEARREVLEDLMDIKHAEAVISRLEEDDITVEEEFTQIPSPFAFNLVAMGFTDIMKMEDKQAFLKRMHNQVLAKISLKQKNT